MARFRFAVFKERLELLTPTKGISDNLNTDSASFDFRTPEWEGLSKWAHFTNYDYEGGVEYDFNLVDDEIPVDEGLNLPPGVWDVYVHAEIIDAQAIVRRLVTNVVSIVSDQSDAYDGQYLPPIGPSVAEQIDAKATAAWDAKITSASAEVHDDVGEPYADVEISGNNGSKNLHFDFHNIKGDPGSDGEKGDPGDPGTSIYSIVRTSGTGAPGTVDTYTVTLTDGTIGGTFEVYNGADGAGTVQSVSGILPDASGDIPLIIFGTGAPTTSTAGYEKQLYFDTISSLIYMCTDDSDPYVWALASGSVTGVKGDAESTYRTGDVNLTPENIGAASIADLAKVFDAGTTTHSDCNTFVEGLFKYGTNTLNTPETGYGFVVGYVAQEKGWKWQIAVSTSNPPKIFKRNSINNGGWRAWKRIADENDVSTLSTAIDSKTSAMIVDVSDTQPTDPDNKLWIPEVVTETQVPTWEEHQELSGAINTLQTDFSGDTAISAESGLFTTTKFFRTTANIPLGSTGVTLKAYSRGVIISNNGVTGAIIATEYGGQTYIAFFDRSAIVSANTLFDNKNLQDVTPTMKNCTVTYTTRQCKYKYLSNNMLYVWIRIRGQITAVDSSPYALIDISSIPNILDFDGNYASVTIRESTNCCTTLPYNALASKAGNNMYLQFQTDGGTTANTWKVTPSGGTFYANISAIFIKP